MYKFAIIEDEEPTSAEFMAYLMAAWPDCTVDQFGNFKDGLVAIRAHEYDLIISDLNLGPGSERLAGFKLAHGVDASKTPFLIVSGLDLPNLREFAEVVEAWDYMQKPISSEDLIREVRRALAFRNEVRANSAAVKDPRLDIDVFRKDIVKWNGKRVTLSITQVRLIEELASNPNKTVAYEVLTEHLPTGRNKNNLRVHIAKIKEAFTDVEPDFSCIQNTPLAGYRWVSE
jgi:DNA-binding response OmpR family regulator